MLPGMKGMLRTLLPMIGRERNRWEDGLWLAFLVWSLIGLGVVAFDIHPLSVEQWQLPGFMGLFVKGCLAWGDFLSNLLAALVVGATALRHLRAKAMATAAAVIMIGSGVVETIGTLTGFPFGAYTYQGNMGPQIGPLPLAIPLAWWVVVVGAYFTLHMALPSLSHWRLALLTGVVAVVFDWILEPFAWQVRGYWIWHGGEVPMANYLSWFGLAVLFAGMSPLHRAHQPPHDGRPAGVLLLMVLLFVLGRVVAGV